mgnify:CR=1 FL=1
MKKIKILINKSWFCPYLQRLRRLDYIIYYKYYCYKGSTKNKFVLMASDSRESLGGNLEFLDTELKTRGYKITYFLKKNLNEKKTKKDKKLLCKMMAEAQYILLDDFYPIIYAIPIRKETKVIQVWHALGAFKTVGFSRVGKPGGPNPRSLSHKNYSATITSSESIRKDYAEAFGISLDKVYATGIPRTDVLFDDDYKSCIRDRIFSKYPQLKDKKVILFAPTFRGNGQKTAYYNFEWIDFKKIKEELGEKYCFIIKLHPFVHNIESIPEDDNFFLNMTQERDINDLLLVTDILITDYSSVIFEAALLDIDTIFYVPDIEEYTASRDFYYPFEEYMFGQLAKTKEELIEAIKAPQNNREKKDMFKKKFCDACDGKSTKRVVDELMTS